MYIIQWFRSGLMNKCMQEGHKKNAPFGAVRRLCFVIYRSDPVLLSGCRSGRLKDTW